MKSSFVTATLFVLVLLQQSVSGQTYTLSTYQAPYVSVGVGFPLTKAVWDDPGYSVPLNYQFTFFDDIITDLESVEDYTGGGIMSARLEGDIASVFGVYGPDIIDRGFHTGVSASAIYFAYSGEPGQRVYIQEWLNVGFANGDTLNGMYTDYVNFQLQLHEATREIIYHFGSSSITNPTADYEGNAGPSLGILKEVDITGLGVPEETFLLSGNPSNPTVVTEFLPVFLNGTIPENTVYRFTQPGTAVKEHFNQKQESVFYPNPSSGEVFIKQGFEDKVTFPLQMFGPDGMLVKEIKEQGLLDVYDLPTGIYEIRFRTSEGWNTERMVVIN